MRRLNFAFLLILAFAATSFSQQPSATTHRIGVVVRASHTAAERAAAPKGGVFVASVEPGSFAAGIGLKAGVQIVEVNRKPVPTTAAYQAILASLKPGDDIVFVVRASSGSGGNAYLGGTLPEGAEAADASSVEAPPPGNADLVTMIKGGLPESVVIKKIHGDATRWDTSAEALVALKQAGATEAELNALMENNSPVAAEPTVDAAAATPNAFTGASLPTVMKYMADTSVAWKQEDGKGAGLEIAFGGKMDMPYGGGSCDGCSTFIAFEPELDTNPATCRGSYKLGLMAMIGPIGAANPENFQFDFSFADIKDVQISTYPLPPDTVDQPPVPMLAVSFEGIDHAPMIFIMEDDAMANKMSDAIVRTAELCEGQGMNVGERIALAGELQRFKPAPGNISEEALQYVYSQQQQATNVEHRTEDKSFLSSMMDTISQGVSQMADQAAANNAAAQARLARQQNQIAAAQAQREAEQEHEASLRRQEAAQARTSAAASSSVSRTTRSNSSYSAPTKTVVHTPAPVPAPTTLVASNHPASNGVVSACLYDPNVPAPTSGPCAQSAPSSSTATNDNGASTISASGSDASGSANGSMGGMERCLQLSYPGQTLHFTNTCAFPVRIEYFIGSSSAPSADTLDPGGVDNTFYSVDQVNASDGVRYYACVKGYVVVDPNGVMLSHPSATYHCEMRN